MKPYLILLASLTLSTSAFALDPDVEAVPRIVEAAKGKVGKTEDGQSLNSSISPCQVEDRTIIAKTIRRTPPSSSTSATSPRSSR